MPDIRGSHIALILAALLTAFGVVIGCGPEVDKIPAAPLVDASPPAVPDGLVATVAADGAVLLHWDANLTDPDLVGYVVYRSEEAVGGFQARHDRPLSTNAWRDEQVRADGSYVYRVAARDASRNESTMSRECRITVESRPRSPGR
jgi:hypothetical protein